MRQVIEVATHAREQLVDITPAVTEAVAEMGIKDGLMSVYVQGATAGVMIQENWDDSVPRDVVRLLQEVIPRGVWEHDRQDGNGDSHLKSGLVGPSETIPLIEGRMGLSTWQGLFLCEFDGPRTHRRIVVTALPDRLD